MSLSEIRVNTTKTRTGVGTITYTETGPVITGIATASNFKTGSTNVHSTGVELANINTGGSTATFGGAISGTTASFSGTVSIGGTLTYEDVTNIDSVGIITARDGLKVLAGGANVVGVITATRAVSGTGDLLKLTSTENSQSSRPGISFWNSNPNTAQAQISAKGGASYNASKLHFAVANTSRALQDRACIDEYGTFIIGPGEVRRNTKGSSQYQALLVEGTGNNSTCLLYTSPSPRDS